MKNEVSKMNEKKLKEYLQTNAENWKELYRKNCVTLTTLYENEADSLAQLKKRYEITNG